MNALVLDSHSMTQVLEPASLLDTMRRGFASAEDRQTLNQRVGIQVERSSNTHDPKSWLHLHDTQTGQRLASFDAVLLKTLSTGIVTAIATDVLARADAERVALIGTGTTAEWVLRMLSLVRRIRYASAYDSIPFRTGPFLRHLANHTGARLVATDSLADAVTGADIVVMATGGLEPMLFTGMVSPGVHVNALPVDTPPAGTWSEGDASSRVAGGFDLDPELLFESRVFSGDVSDSAEDRAEDDAEDDEALVVTSLGAVIRGDASERSHPDEITVYRHAGHVWQDLVVAWHLYEMASAKGAGKTPDLPPS
jgi:alanine dehydrogenase